ncbi:MAG: hypothetical protein A3D46_00380 [Candidatus Nealsonbacteria bacterium RIFCSPHIGHO2_02_FULL_43_13]|uniref:Uncharacterized protein n=1 Tax=Candidatus Nealsonbacteria bacterium RIFCSPHIGHO2_02_FULL_43_13 TaxID=1801668 RepID=A0A1G2E7U9_9BACT|nr:MAG: hypothetical protein A3D46_00380 [Candidatus Nealsonbacteria bacterium RIFCSPHIGHO2_02_FULL_43_13]
MRLNIFPDNLSASNFTWPLKALSISTGFILNSFISSANISSGFGLTVYLKNPVSVKMPIAKA